MNELEQRMYDEEKARTEAIKKVKAEENSKKNKKALKIIGFAFLLFVIIGFFNPSAFTGKGSNDVYAEKLDAVSMAQVFVERQLKAPSSAQFSSLDETRMSKVNENGKIVYEIGGYVDAENSFGAKIRSVYFVRMIKFGSNYELISVRIK